jgi:molybdate transport system ATP-binding protein
LLERIAPAVDAGARPGSLSGGERQRVALARALVSQPRLLVLDEPFSNVDVSARSGLRALIRDTARSFGGATVLIAHDPLDALTLADRVALLDAGTITQTGTPAEIRARPSSRYAADLVGVNLFAGVLEPLEDGAATLRTPDGAITVSPEVAVAHGDRAIASLKPIDVSLHAGPPEGSARNVFRGRIEEIAIDGDRARIRVGTRPPLMAAVTAGSVERMDLREGGEIWASFKAVEVSLQIDADTAEDPPTGTLAR